MVGCAQGHGRAVAKGCAGHGAECLLIDRNPDIGKVSEAIRAGGGESDFRNADVSRPEALKQAMADLAGDRGLDGLLYFPRGRIRKSWDEITPEDWDAELDVSLKGAFFGMQAAVPHLGKDGKSAFIITMSSVLSGYVGTESAAYHSAKGGLESLTRYMAVQLGPRGIRVNAVQIGWMIKDEDMARFNEPGNQEYRSLAERVHPLRRVGTSRDLLETVVFLGSEQSSFFTGQVFRIDGGLTVQEPTTLFQSMQSDPRQ